MILFFVVRELVPNWKGDDGRTLATGISLHELFFGACLLELWGEPCQLWQQFVHDPQLRCKIIFVNMECEVSADEACDKV